MDKLAILMDEMANLNLGNKCAIMKSRIPMRKRGCTSAESALCSANLANCHHKRRGTFIVEILRRIENDKLRNLPTARTPVLPNHMPTLELPCVHAVPKVGIDSPVINHSSHLCNQRLQPLGDVHFRVADRRMVRVWGVIHDSPPVAI